MKKLSILLILLFLFSSCGNKEKGKAYQVTETYRITSSAGTTSFLSVDLPVSYGYQTIGDIKVNNTDMYSIEQKDGYQTLLASLSGEGNEKTITITYDVSLKKGECTWPSETSDKYLLPEGSIDSDHKSIVELAKSLEADGDKLQTAKNISHYVSENIKFDYSTKINQETPPASLVLDNKKGVCQDYANLMVALLRASGIPSKNISGLVLNKLESSGDWSSPAASHAWVEFSIGEQWYFADPTWGDKYFTNPDGYHLSYGEEPVDVNSEAFQSRIGEIEDNGFKVLGAMTAPIKFIAWSEDENASITPKVEMVKK